MPISFGVAYDLMRSKKPCALNYHLPDQHPMQPRLADNSHVCEYLLLKMGHVSWLPGGGLFGNVAAVFSAVKETSQNAQAFEEGCASWEVSGWRLRKSS